MKINATLPEKGRDLRLDLFRGIANWAIFLDHIPDNVVNWITTRNYGFSDAADLFVFISGYTASFVYARMMLERGFIVGATRLTKRVWQLYVAHIILFVIYIAAISYLALRFGDSEIINEFNVRPRRSGDGDAAPGVDPQIQAGQSGRIAALHRPDGILSASALAHAAPARSDHDRLDPAVAARAAFRLEFSGLSRRKLVLQSVLLAGAVRIRLVVRTRRCQEKSLGDRFSDHALCLCRLPSVCDDHDHGRQVSGFRRPFSGLALLGIQSERQDQPCALPLPAFCRDRHPRHPLRTERVVGTGVEDIRSGDRLRPAVPRRVLRWRLPVVRRTFRTDDEFGLILRAALRQRDRDRDHDRRRLLHLVVEATG